MFMTSDSLSFAAIIRTPGVSGVATRAVTKDDGGEASGDVTGRSLQRGGSSQSIEVIV